MAEAAAVPLGGLNALHFLRRAEVQPGDTVLINGAGGVIGAYGVQIATSMGATVTGVDASHKEAFVRSMGASEFIDYRTTDITTVSERFDVIFDMVPGTRVAAMTRLLKPGGRYANGNPRTVDVASGAARPLQGPHDDRRLCRRNQDGASRACPDDRCRGPWPHR